MAKRMNAGKSADLPVLIDGIEFNNPDNASIEIWTLYDRGDKDGFQRWKLAAQTGTSVLGKANYALVLQNKVLWTKDGGGDLKTERPGLFAIVASFALEGTAPTEPVSTQNDPYGDDAMSRGQKPTQGQVWNRALLRMRETHLHWECRPDRDNLPEGVVRTPSWEPAVRQAWFGIFRGNLDDALMAHKESIAADAKVFGADLGKPDYRGAVEALTNHLTRDMEQQLIDEATAFITAGNCRDADFDEYMKVVKAFYDGAYSPRPMETYAAKFDQLTGLGVAADFDAVIDAVVAGAKEALESPNEVLASFDELL